MKKFLLVLTVLLFATANSVFAKIGVGVGTGKIQVEDKLKPGLIYELPPLTIINTGDEPSDYEIQVSYHDKQPQLRPKSSWFIFNPVKFHLEPGKLQTVAVKLNLPVRTAPGEYFAYLEGHPFKKAQSGNTTIGVAAAAKLYFTVVPANFFQAVFYKVISFWNVYSPWTGRITLLAALIIIFILFKKFFNIQIKVNKPASQPKTEINKKDE